MRCKVFENVPAYRFQDVIDEWARETEREIVSVTQVSHSRKEVDVHVCKEVLYITTTIFYKEVR